MEIKGKIIQVLPVKTWVGQYGPGGRAIIVIEWNEGNYIKKLALENTKNYEQFSALQVGQSGTFRYDVTSSEYNGNWFTRATCFGWTIDGATNEPF